MSELKYKVGDRVRIKSIDWYNENKDEYGCIECSSRGFFEIMCQYCGKILTINSVDIFDKKYKMIEDGCRFDWTDEMIEGLVEEGDRILVDNLSSRWVNEFNLPDGYIFKDVNGNEIHATKIVLEKANTLKIQSDNMETETHRGYCTTEEDTNNKSKKVAWFTFEDNDFADKVELALSNRELIQEDGKWFVVKKKKEYPKTYGECCKIMQVARPNIWFDYYDVSSISQEGDEYERHIELTLCAFRKLLICRDAYWKLYGEEIGLGKPWKPSKDKMVYCFYRHSNEIETDLFSGESVIFEFPTKEMREVFKENFGPYIEFCKELL